MDDFHTRTNRENSLKPSKQKFYCLCDLNMISKGEKCCVCSRRQRKNFKKDKI